jgi:hypothetical protein
VAIADDVDDDDDKNFDVVEKFGKGAAKVRAICCSFSVEAKDMDLGRNSGDQWATPFLGGIWGIWRHGDCIDKLIPLAFRNFSSFFRHSRL